MAQKTATISPITGVCVVSDPQKCPPSFELLMRSKDKEADCDLWRETNMFKKTTRYLCFTRSFSKNSQDNKVLVSIQLLNEREPPPPGLTVVEKTADSEERAFKKKTFCVKYVDRNSLSEAICDIALLTKMKRAPEGYTLIGEVNGVIICVKVGRIPPETQNFSHAGNNALPFANGLRAAPAPPIAGYTKKPAPQLSQSLNVPSDKNDGLSINALSGVDFQLNQSSLAHAKQSSLGRAPSLSFRSLNDIDNEYHYSFAVEKSILRKTKA